MNKRTWSATIFALAICGGVGWIAGCSGFTVWGQRAAPLASIQRADSTTGGETVSDEEARARVLQLIDLKAITHELNRSYLDTPISGVLEDDPFVVVMPRADEMAATPVPSPEVRFDLWLVLFSPSPTLMPPGYEERSERKAPLKKQMRTPRECEECPEHPEVDTLEFRSSDAKKGEYEAFQRRAW